MMRKSGLFIFFVSSLLFACSSSTQTKPGADVDRWFEDADNIKVLSSTAMIGDIVSRIGGDKIVHLSLIIGDVDPHSYELVKGDDEKIQFADVIFYNGIGLEHGASLKYRLSKHLNAVSLGEALLNEDRADLLMVENVLDPHIWMDVSLWAKIIPYIVKALSNLDPESAAFFQSNAESLSKEMRELDEEIFQKFQKIPANNRYLVTSHDAFNYFTRRYLTELGESDDQRKLRFQAPEGLAPDGQLSLMDLKRIIEHLCTYQIPVVFPESNLSRDALKKIISVCAKKGHIVEIAREPLYGDTMGSTGSMEGSYLQMMRHNGNTISQYLSKQVAKVNNE